MKFILKSAAIAVAGALVLSACAQGGGAADKPAASSKAQKSGPVTAVGAFTGDKGHVVTGNASVSRVDGQWVVTLDEGFSLDGAPDPKVAFGDGSGYVEGTILGKLQNLKGKQSYVVPSNLDVGDYVQVYIWCEQFAVPLGHANLKLT